MADFGIGETIALSAALGAGSAAMKNQDPLRGALIGGVLGGATAGIGSAIGGAGAAAGATEGVIAPELANTTIEAANLTPSGVKDIMGSQFADGISQYSPPQGIDSLSQATAPTTFDRSFENAANPPLQNNPNGKGFFDQSTKTFLGDAPLSNLNKMAATGIATTLTPMLNQTQPKYGTNPVTPYSGPLSQLHYDPSKYVPTIPAPPNPPYKVDYSGYAGYKGFAEGGITSLAEGGYFSRVAQENDARRAAADAAAAAAAPKPEAPSPVQAAPVTDYIYRPSYAGYAGSQEAQSMPQNVSGAYPMGDIPTPTRVPVQSSQQFNPKFIPGNPAYNAEQDRLAAVASEKEALNFYTAPGGQVFRNYDAYINSQGNNGGSAAGGGLMPRDLRYAAGGIAQLPQTNFAIGGSAPLVGTPAANTTMDSTVGNNSMFPMSEMDRSYYATPTQLPSGISNSANPSTPQSMAGTTGGYEAKVNPYTGVMGMAGGGITGLLKGQGDGMSDDIHATIGGSQPARLADGEFVIPADVVSHLGNGSTDAGAKHLYAMMDKVRRARTGRKSQGKQIKAGGYLPA